MYYVLTFLLFALTGWLIALTGTQKRFLHLLQLEDYESGRMLRQVVRNPGRLQLFAPELIAIAMALIIGSWIMFFPAVEENILLLGSKRQTYRDRSGPELAVGMVYLGSRMPVARLGDAQETQVRQEAACFYNQSQADILDQPCNINSFNICFDYSNHHYPVWKY